MSRKNMSCLVPQHCRELVIRSDDVQQSGVYHDFPSRQDHCIGVGPLNYDELPIQPLHAKPSVKASHADLFYHEKERPGSLTHKNTATLHVTSSRSYSIAITITSPVNQIEAKLTCFLGDVVLLMSTLVEVVQKLWRPDLSRSPALSNCSAKPMNHKQVESRKGVQIRAGTCSRACDPGILHLVLPGHSSPLASLFS